MSQTRPVSIPNTRQIDFVSRVNRRKYSLSVALPLTEKPRTGYRVLYVIDGFSYFASAVEAVRANNNAPDVVVVGIGYPEDPAFIQRALARRAPLPPSLEKAPSSISAFLLERFYDLTLPSSDPANDEVLAIRGALGLFVPSAKDVGGLGDFLETIETEVKPRIEALTEVDHTEQAIFGHSLGGLAVLHALFVEPNAFRTFVAASPSIWWNRKMVLANEASFAAAVRAGAANPRILITMGGEEGVATPELAKQIGLDPTHFAEMVRNARMIENARELTARLQSLQSPGDFEVEDYVVFPEQGHGISPWPALGRAIAFAFQRSDSRNANPSNCTFNSERRKVGTVRPSGLG